MGCSSCQQNNHIVPTTSVDSLCECACGCAEPVCPTPQPCTEITDAKCIIYTNAEIKCGTDVVVTLNSTLATALNQIVNYFCQQFVTLDVPEDIIYDGDVIVTAGTSVVDAFQTVIDFILNYPNNYIGGSGTTNFLPKWTPNGTTLGNSQIKDDGTTAGIGSFFGSPIYKWSVLSALPNLFMNDKINTTTPITALYGICSDNTIVPKNNLSASGVVGIADSSTIENIGVTGSATGTGSGANIGVYGSGIAALNASCNKSIGGKFIAGYGNNNYAVQLKDGTQGVGKVLTCMTTDGEANWTEANKQKVITATYVLTDADNDYTIFVNNGATAISISLGAITIPNFNVGFIQEGSADVTFTGTGLGNPIGFKLKGQGYQAYIERKLATSTYYLLGNTKA